MTREHSQTLEEELGELLTAAGLDDRQAGAVSARLGWDGKGGTTLQAASELAGVTRERVRQLEQRVRKHVKDTRPSLPTVVAAVKTLDASAPISRTSAARALRKRGLAAGPFDPAGVINAVELFGRSPVSIVGATVFPAGDESVPRRLLDVTRKLVTHNGAGRVDGVVDILDDPRIDAEVARRYLDLEDEVIWLDGDRQWFFLPTTRNRAVNHLRKMFSVSRSLTLDDLREGCRRHDGREVNLSKDVLREFCKALGWITFDGDVATATVELDYRDVLENTEETLVDVFLDAGPVLDRPTAVDAAHERGLDRTTAALYLFWSPVIQKIATNRYALRGADIPAGTLEAMGTPQRRRVQLDHGWTREGRLRVVYRISQPVIDSNVVGIPGALKRELPGRFEVETEFENLGEIASDGVNLWGLGRLLRQSGAEAGDVLVLEFDLSLRTVRAAVGGDELLDRL